MTVQLTFENFCQMTFRMILSAELNIPEWLSPSAKVRCNSLQHTATHCNTLQHTSPSGCLGLPRCAATHCNNTATTLQHTTITLQRTEYPRVALSVCQGALQYTATHCCNTLQHTATHYNNTVTRWISPSGSPRLPRCAATHCVAVCCISSVCKRDWQLSGMYLCSVLHCVASASFVREAYSTVEYFSAVCCSLLQQLLS